MSYSYCSICGGGLQKSGNGNLSCKKCDFINYRNPRPTVTALVLNKNRLLLTRRAGEPFAGWWDLPGGFIDRNETPEKALIRELKEETGLKIKLKKLFGMYIGTYPSKSDPFNILSIVYITSTHSEKLEAFDDVCESKWFSKKEITKKIAFDSNQNIIKDFLKIWK